MTNSVSEDHGHILVVDDDPQIRLLVARFLQRYGYQVTGAPDGRVMRDVLTHTAIDLIVLDLMLPGRSGVELCRDVRVTSQVPIVMLTARSEESDRIMGLEGGADDYVTKPFGMDEFLARLRAAVRRGAAASETDEPVIETSSFTVDLAAKKVTKNNHEVHLTPTEWGMLEMLVRNRGKLVGREELLREVWGPAYAKETHYLRVYLAQLRRKLEDDPSHPVHLLTEAGMGYRFQE